MDDVPDGMKRCSMCGAIYGPDFAACPACEQVMLLERLSQERRVYFVDLAKRSKRKAVDQLMSELDVRRGVAKPLINRLLGYR